MRAQARSALEQHLRHFPPPQRRAVPQRKPLRVSYAIAFTRPDPLVRVETEIEEQRQIGPSLGEDSIHKSVFAGELGLVAVLIFMVLYYRFAGLVAWVVLAAVLPRGLPGGIVALGIVTGALTSLTAFGLVLVYRSCRIVNC